MRRAKRANARRRGRNRGNGARSTAGGTFSVADPNPSSVEQRQVPLSEALRVAMAHHQVGRLAEAERIYQQVLDASPDHPDALQLLGLLAADVHKPELAEQLMRRSLARQPDNAAVWSNLGNLYWKLRRLREAENCCREALRINPGLAVAHVNLGNALEDQGRTVEASDCYRRAAELRPEYQEAHKNLGVTLLERGDVADAIACFDRALELRPDDANLHRHLVATRKYTQHDQHVELMENLYARSDLDGDARMHLGFALGKVYEDLHEYDKSFACLEVGNRLKRATYEYDSGKAEALFREISAGFDRDLFVRRAGSGCPDTTPIFVLGLPRSGTTLVEQILASHPEVHGAGELPYLRHVVVGAGRKLTGRHFPQGVEDFTPEILARLGRGYVQALRRYAPTARRITDKMPGNILYIGMIKLMLPAAKVIHCRRDPLDTCYSIYKTYFTGEQPFAYDQRELGQYYRLCEDLMSHWREMLPEFILDIGYEDVVADQETQSRRLLEFCGLEWDQACLEFHKAGRTVRTASAAQVRRPVYKTSVHAWKNYERHLRPLMEALTADGSRNARDLLVAAEVGLGR